ncbi:MAG: ribose-phosphate pyrophosphokinase-like domain-containing protein, partial [Thermodesulfovibrionales bacterium]|nr:ribose-phosphate pyrophosphokinase-like domain-containing protein [Thermodesulfovibrionales bacterium]
MPNSIKLLTGNSNRKLANEVAEYLGIPVCDTLITTFSDGEIMVQINENVRGSDIFALQSTCTPVNDNI